MFQLTDEEHAALRSHFATLKLGRGQHRKYLPHAFTEHGAIMAATILNSPRDAQSSSRASAKETAAAASFILRRDSRVMRSPI